HTIGGSTLQLFDTIVAQNSATLDPDINGAVQSLGHNLIGDPTGATGLVASDLQNVPSVQFGGTLGIHGGPVPTLPLAANSPALDAGDSAGVPATDQRGFNRVVNGAVDIGAF